MNGQTAKVSVTVAIAPALAFELFTCDIDRWWCRGVKYRYGDHDRGFICLEPGVGGRLFESFDMDEGSQVFEVGRITVWEPPQRLVFTWRNSNYAPGEHTLVEIGFSAAAAGTLVTVTHRGLTALRPDHPARHGLPDGDFLRMIGHWWGDQLTSLRDLAANGSNQGR